MKTRFVEQASRGLRNSQVNCLIFQVKLEAAAELT